jgi:hypothetical protein
MAPAYLSAGRRAKASQATGKSLLVLFFRKEQKKDSSFSEEKEAKRLLFFRCCEPRGQASTERWAARWGAHG